MSDEPKKPPRRWVGWALLVVFVLYPLSMGPVSWMHLDWAEPAYRPLTHLSVYLPRPIFNVALWYVWLFR
jgi:hypothetical protein